MANTEVSNYDVFNRELIIDLNLGAFYVYDIGAEVDSPVVRDYLQLPTSVISEETVNLYSGNNQLTDGGGNPITAIRIVTSTRTTDERKERFKFVTTSSTDFTLSEYKDYRFKDWYSYDNTGQDYNAFLITGYELGDNMLLNKQSIYLMVYCERTEVNYITSSGSVILSRQSSCKVQSQWNWNNSTAQGKWGTVFQAYRLLKNQPASPSSGDTFDYGDTVIVTKNKLRGRGRALSLYFNSDPGKDLKLLGWGLEVTANNTP